MSVYPPEVMPLTIHGTDWVMFPLARPGHVAVGLFALHQYASRTPTGFLIS